METYIEDMTHEELINTLGDVVSELKSRESDFAEDTEDNEGFETIETIDYLVGKYNNIVENRFAN